MNHVSISTALSQRHARMPLKAEQHCHIAAAYDKAAFDITLPTHTRAAFARKADWFRLLARVAEKRERATLPTDAARKPREAPPDPFWFWGLLERDDGALWDSLHRARRYASEVISRVA
jgi:hypothetical protein